MGALASARILVVDPDAGLLGLLQSLLEEAGCAVDTVCGSEGFTPDLMALTHPNVVFLNPAVPGMARGAVREVVRTFRRKEPKATLLLIGQNSPEELQRAASELEADGYMPTATLLRNPVGGLPASALPAVPVHPVPRARVAAMEPEEILDLELVVPEMTPPPQRNARTPAPQGASLSTELVKMLEDELLEPDQLEVVEHFDVALDVLNENNLYGPSGKGVTGVFVAASVRPKVGATVELAVTFPWGTKYELVGTVEWAKDMPRVARRQRGGFGVKLPELTALQKSMFERFAGLRQPMLSGE